MRFSLIRLAQGAKSAWKEKGPMAILDRPSNSALARKYNYGIRQETMLDDLHGYGWWVVHKHFDELWPLVGCFAFLGFFMSYVIWWQFQKTEVHFNRFSEHRPWDWERAQHVYDKRHKAFFNDSAMWHRIPELDKLQAEMLEVKKQRLAEAKAHRKDHH